MKIFGFFTILMATSMSISGLPDRIQATIVEDFALGITVSKSQDAPAHITPAAQAQPKPYNILIADVLNSILKQREAAELVRKIQSSNYPDKELTAQLFKQNQESQNKKCLIFLEQAKALGAIEKLKTEPAIKEITQQILQRHESSKCAQLFAQELETKE